MKYHVENRLDLFEFHDAEFSFIEYNKSTLILSAKHLNIHKNVEENPHNCDMEVDVAQFIFSGFEVVSFEPMRAYQIDDDSNAHTDEPQIIYDGEKAQAEFLNEAKKGITINCIEIFEKENRTYIELSTCAQTCFFATFAFEKVVVNWNEYLKKAWYELHKQYINKGYLLTENGEQETEIHIVFHEEDMYYEGEPEKGPTVNVGVKYDKEQLWGHGKEYLWEDAFANVQKQLPNGVLLKCCMTCRHGNLCPFGNEPATIFCTKGLAVNSKEELCNLFNNWELSGIYEKAKNVWDSCDGYAPQGNDYFTYNDYLYYLTSETD